MPLDDEVDDLLGDRVGKAEVGAGDHDEPEHDRGGLPDLTAVRPLHALQFGPRRAQEREEAVAARALGRGRARPARRDGVPAGGLVHVVFDLVEVLVAEVLGVLPRDVGAPRLGGAGVLGLLLAVGAGDQGGLELLDVAGGVLERSGDVLLVDPSRGRPRVRVAAGAALLRALSVTGHGEGSRTSGSPDATCATG